jgi:hypothetical protein
VHQPKNGFTIRLIKLSQKKNENLFVCHNYGTRVLKNEQKKNLKKFFKKALTIQNCFLCLHSQSYNLQISLEFPGLLNLF